MTDCSTQLELPLGVGKKVVGVFDGGRITSDGGLSVVSLADGKLGLTQGLVKCLKDGRQEGKASA